MKSLQPQNGERILEVGAGVGIHALPTAVSVMPGGVLDVFDAQTEMLDAIMQRAAKYGITNIHSVQGDARSLPYPDRAFNAAYMIGVLGEIPDPTAALRELRRVLKPEGRLLIGEVLIDPDFIPFRTLRRLAENTGFSLTGRRGLGFAYIAKFHPAAAV
jgi:ubiquinone/menaquinone biosynthesis C-methylase UbiE